MTNKSASGSPSHKALRSDRLIIISGVFVVTLLAWLWLVDMANGMPSGAMMGMASMDPWASSELFSMLVMWIIMMVGMMLPSATPIILIHARVVTNKNTVKYARLLY